MPGAGAGRAAVAAGGGTRDAERGRQLGRPRGSWTPRGSEGECSPAVPSPGKCGRGGEGSTRGAGAGGGGLGGVGRSGRTANAPSLQAEQPTDSYLLTSTFWSIFNMN